MPGVPVCLQRFDSRLGSQHSSSPLPVTEVACLQPLLLPCPQDFVLLRETLPVSYEELLADAMCSVLLATLARGVCWLTPYVECCRTLSCPLM